jgi:predicted nucleic acid-binding protein
MKVFLDTNILMESITNRSHSTEIARIYNLYKSGVIDCYISQGSFYTITYLVEAYLKKTDSLSKDERLNKLRNILNNILLMSDICDISNEELSKGIWDTNFTDIEDSYQYQNAIAEQCEYLITLNKKDFHPHNEQIEIVTPDEFIKRISSGL